MTTLGRTPDALTALFALAFAASLSGCGGGGDDGSATVPTPPPPAAFTTTVSGAVVKGPVTGAQICAYTVVANARGAALGSCTTSDAAGNYSLAVPAGSGALWMEATGGSYVDEVTQATRSLPVGAPLVSLVAANGSTVTTMLTPLTTLALNAARTATGTSGTLDASAYSSAVTQLMSSFNLPAGLNITTTLPTFGAGINSHGTVLTAVSQMVANGTSLATILATTNPGLLQAAFAAAAAPVVPPPTSGGAPSASGTVTVAGAPAGGATSVTPQADGFKVEVNETETTYTFLRRPNSTTSGEEIIVTVLATGAVRVGYVDISTRSSVVCTSNCGVTITTPAGASHPVTVALAGTRLGTSGVTLTGSLVGDAPGALWSPQELPRTTTGPVTLGGASLAVLSSSEISFVGTTRQVVLNLADGSILSVVQPEGAAPTVLRVLAPATVNQCSSNCGITWANTSTGSRIAFSNTPLTSDVLLNGTVDIGKTSGSLTSSDAGGFTPVNSSVKSVNALRTITFSVLGTAAQAGLSLVTVGVRNGVVISAQATVGIATQVFSCFETASAVAPACTGITLAGDGRSFTFTNVTLLGGSIGQAARNVVFNGSLVAKGL
jgi:hypothetical protein